MPGPHDFLPWRRFRSPLSFQSATPPAADQLDAGLDADQLADVPGVSDDTSTPDDATPAADQLDPGNDSDAPADPAPAFDDTSTPDDAPAAQADQLDASDAADVDAALEAPAGLTEAEAQADDLSAIDLEYPDPEPPAEPDALLWFDPTPDAPAIVLADAPDAAGTDDSGETLDPADLAWLVEILTTPAVVLPVVPCVYQPNIDAAQLRINEAITAKASAVLRGDSYGVKFWGDQIVFFTKDRDKWIQACATQARLNESEIDRDFRRKQ